MRVTLRPTRTEDLPFLTGEPLPHRIRAVTALLDDRVIGIGGIGYRPDGSIIGFAQIGDEFRRYPTAVHRAGRMGMALIRSTGVPMVLAEAQPGNVAAEPWLLRLGFKPVEISGRRAFVWKREGDRQ